MQEPLPRFRNKNPDSYDLLNSWIHQNYEQLCKTPLISAPWAYKVSRFQYCINSWMDTDAEMVAALWVEYTLVVSALIDLNTVPTIPDEKTLNQMRKDQLKELANLAPQSFIDSPLAMRLETYGLTVRTYFLQCLGCNVPDVSEAFFQGLWDLYLYLILETRALTRKSGWGIFRKHLRLVANFEL